MALQASRQPSPEYVGAAAADDRGGAAGVARGGRRTIRRYADPATDRASANIERGAVGARAEPTGWVVALGDAQGPREEGTVARCSLGQASVSARSNAGDRCLPARPRAPAG